LFLLTSSFSLLSFSPLFPLSSPLFLPFSSPSSAPLPLSPSSSISLFYSILFSLFLDPALLIHLRWTDQQWWPRPIAVFSSGNISEDIYQYEVHSIAQHVISYHIT
jgi:hypothetical protein